MQMRHCITLPVFGTHVLLIDDLFGHSMKPVLLTTSQACKTIDDSGLERGRGREVQRTKVGQTGRKFWGKRDGYVAGLDFGDDCGKERLLTGSMSCLL